MFAVSESMGATQPATPEPFERVRELIPEARVTSDRRIFRRGSALIQLAGLVGILGIIAGIVIAATLGGGFGLLRYIGGVDPTAKTETSSSALVDPGNTGSTGAADPPAPPTP